jgi:hypothetical protein
VTFSQLGQMGRHGRRLLPGALGLCMIPTLALLCGSVAAMTAGRNAGLAAGIVSLVLLSVVRAWESRRAATAG